MDLGSGPREVVHARIRHVARARRRMRTGAANAWSIISADAARDLVFVPVGSASPDFYGGERLGQNLFANSVVALRASSGTAGMAFPGGASRSLGLRPPRPAGALHDASRRPRDSRRSRSRPRWGSCSSSIATPASRCSRSRSARVPRERRARRRGVADAAVSDAARTRSCRSQLTPDEAFGVTTQSRGHGAATGSRRCARKGSSRPPAFAARLRSPATSAARTGAALRSIPCAISPSFRSTASRRWSS